MSVSCDNRSISHFIFLVALLPVASKWSLRWGSSSSCKWEVSVLVWSSSGLEDDGADLDHVITCFPYLSLQFLDASLLHLAVLTVVEKEKKNEPYPHATLVISYYRTNDMIPLSWKRLSIWRVQVCIGKGDSKEGSFRCSSVDGLIFTIWIRFACVSFCHCLECLQQHSGQLCVYLCVSRRYDCPDAGSIKGPSRHCAFPGLRG